jgi:M6 family metalloprotease-like protein/uncharacterized repeat protein (TIGR02543 family)
MNNKKRTRRIVAMVLAVLMIGAALVSVLPLFVSAADVEGGISYPITDYNPGEKCYDPIPMLVIMINFDADGDGVDDNANGTYEDSEKVKKPIIDDENDPMYGKENPVYGEQWCHTTEEDWVSRLFSYEGNTLNTYYKYMSNDKFYWIPAEETYGEANNGVVAVTIKNVHPNCIEGSGQWVHCFKQIVEAASEYVDFSIYDKNENGRLEKYELCLAFIIGGAETSSGQTNLKEVFGFHAYYKDVDANNMLTTDGVEVGRSGFFGTGAISGGHALNFGVFAHELGHYLGAPDLYDTKGSDYDLAVGAPSMMASGSHGSTPSHFDPYILSEFGFVAPEMVTADGVYTLYSKASSEGDYNVIKIPTPNPNEYFLIENRFSSIKDGSAFDNGISQGILIWHIDETIHRKTAMTCNTSAHGYDPAVVVYAPISVAGNKGNVLSAYNAFRTTHPTYPNYAFFDPTAYVFPVSKTWYTSMKEAEAEKIKNLRIEVITAPGDETQIKVTGMYDPEFLPELQLIASDWTKTSVKVTGILKTLNNATMTSAKFVLTEKGTGTVVKEEDIIFNSEYTYETLCEGLKPGTEYEYKVVAETSHGNLVVKDSNYTKPEEVAQVKITLVVNSNNIKTTTQTVNVGKTHNIRIELNKSGYTFDGWFLDEEYTTPYTPGVIEKEGDFTIYAKWVKKAVATTEATKKPEITTTAPVVTTAPDTAPSGGCGGASKNAEPVLLGGGVIAAILGAAVGGKSAKKRKSEEE